MRRRHTYLFVNYQEGGGGEGEKYDDIKPALIQASYNTKFNYNHHHHHRRDHNRCLPHFRSANDVVCLQALRCHDNSRLETEVERRAAPLTTVALSDRCSWRFLQRRSILTVLFYACCVFSPLGGAHVMALRTRLSIGDVIGACAPTSGL